MAMYCAQKTFHFLSVFNSPTYILSDISITLRIPHETEAVTEGIFLKKAVLKNFAILTEKHLFGVFF